MRHLLKKLFLSIFILSICCFGFASCNSDQQQNGSNESTVCEHAFGEWHTIQGATCSAEGSKSRVCRKCQFMETGVILKAEHAWQASAVHAPTCMENGYTDYLCTQCGVTEQRDFLPATNHNYQVSKIQNPTCTEKGFTKLICTQCGQDTVKDYTSELGHDYVSSEKVEPTCVTEGKNTFSCSRCKDSYVETLSKISHTVVTDPAIPATCTETGLTEGSHCSVCNEVLKVQQKVPALGHKEAIDKAVSPTCTKTGLTEGSHCSACNEVLKAQQKVPALGHKEAIDKAIAPTCTKTGLTEGIHCSVCNEVLKAQQKVSALGHKAVIDAAVPATCTKTGLTEGSHCSVCHAILVAQQITPLAGHVYSKEEWKCECGEWECRQYLSYNEFYAACTVKESGNTVRFYYDSPTPIELHLHTFALQGSKNYQFVFGSNAGKCKVVSNGTTYYNVTFEIESRTNSYDLMLSDVNFETSRTVIYSNAYNLNLSVMGSSVTLKTTKGADGSPGKSYDGLAGYVQIGNGEPGGHGSNANTVIVCNGMLNITCGTTFTVTGGNGGKGGKGGSSNSSGSSGGRGGNGGNGASAIQANDIQCSFINGKTKSDVSFTGGRGGSEGTGGTGKGAFWIGTTRAPDGNPGSSALATNVEIRYH